jgi:ribosome biogenesis ATPase
MTHVTCTTGKIARHRSIYKPSLVLWHWHSGRSGVIERTASPHGDIGTSRYRYQLARKEQSLQRVSQGPDALNRSMQGLWQRRKVNLNATTQQTVPTSATPTSPAPTSTPTPSDEPPRPEPVPPAFGAVERTPVLPSTSTQSKRKLRSTRGDEGNKRSRTGTGTGNTSKEYTPPTVRLSDLGGVEPCVEKMLELVAMPLTHPEVYLHTGVQPPRGVLLYGPPGCGKTMLANAIGGVRTALFGHCRATRTDELDQELGVPFISVSAPSIVSGMSGESEKTLRETFEEAKVRSSFWNDDVRFMSQSP